jgi:hypothetical protein
LFKQEIGETELIDKVVHINRVAKVVKGGRRFSFGSVKPAKSRRPFARVLKKQKKA